ncbi:hypothetical protein BX616_009448, partial [Lobosporangium transversale]
MSFCGDEGWGIFSERRPMDFTLCFQDSVLTVVPNITLLVVLSPRLHKVLGKGRLKGVKGTIAFYVKFLMVLTAIAIQIALLTKVKDNYRPSSLLSTIIYLPAL